MYMLRFVEKYNSIANAIAIIVALLLNGSIVEGIPLEDFFPFGESVGDTALPKILDTSSPRIDLNISTFPFFGQDHADLYVSEL